MNSKGVTFILMAIGSAIGSYIPALWGASAFSASSILFGSIGAIAGIYIAFKINN